MTVESATFINTLNSALPPGTDPKGEGDDHLRLIKAVLKATFPNNTGALGYIVDGTQVNFPTNFRIYGDFSNVTQSSRTLFQTSTANSATSVGAIPSISNATAGANFIAYAQQDAANSAYLQMSCYGSTAILNANGLGTGAKPAFYITTSGSIRYTIDPSGNHTFSGAVTLSNDVYCLNGNAYRTIQGNYGVFWRMDASNFYLMCTASGDPYGGYNSMRPIMFTMSTGNLTLCANPPGTVNVGSDLVLGQSTSPYSKALMFNGGGYVPIIRVNGTSQCVEFVNSANTQLNFSVRDNGDIITRGYVYVGQTQARVASDGNVWGSIWGNDWLSTFLAGKQPSGNYVKAGSNSIQINWDGRLRMYVDGTNQGLMWTDTQLILSNNTCLFDGMQQLGFIGSDTTRPYFMQVRNGTTVELMLQRAGGPMVNRPIRSNGYIEWQTDLGSVGTNYFVSDEATKENLTPNTKSYWDKALAIKFFTYDFLPEYGGEHVDLGVSAQQIQRDVSPDYVNEMTDGKLAPDSNDLLLLALKTIQELQVRVTTLEARLQ